MLRRISCTNFVLFDQLEIDLDQGFTVISGETGAGKSLLIDAITIGLGTRATENPVRGEAKQTSISLSFDKPDSKDFMDFCDHYGLDIENEIHLRRVIQKSGQSKAFINDQAVTLATLKTLGEILLETVGQFSTQSLLNPQTHLAYLDRYGQLETEVEATNTSYQAWQIILKDICKLEEEMQLLKRDADFHLHALKELDDTLPQPDEETSLVEKRTGLMQTQRSQDALSAALQKLSGEKEIDAQIFSAQRDLQRVADDSTPKLNSLIDAFEKLGTEARDLLETLKDAYFTSIQGGQSLEEVDDRLHLLRGLARKYQTHGDGLYDYHQKLKQQVSDTTQHEETLKLKKQDAAKAYKDYQIAAFSLSEKRKKAAQLLTQEASDLLPALKLDKARFEIEVTCADPLQGQKTGIDTLHMRVSMNPGTPLSPIHKVASGGELSRFLLILSSLCSFENKTILFDEIDTGVGGAVASAMGVHLKKMSQHQQVIALTHAPQIAALADRHFHAEKDQQENTLTRFTLLDEKGHKEEIARMLSGASVTDAARKAAKSLIEASQDAA